jgi:serine/threonine protein kinase/tetratricopeptide (TPR) repeat protein
MAMMPSPGRPHGLVPPSPGPELDPEHLRLWVGPGSGVAPSSIVSGLESILEEFTRRWGLGEGPRAEDYLHRLPPGDTEGPIELIYHEYCLRVSSGARPGPDDFTRRFPEHRDRLLRLIALREALPSLAPGPAEAPTPFKPGDQVGSYRLLRELGRGGFARVFLAADAALEDRLVVVKVSGRPSAEHRYLARAPHPHIVPILRERTTEDGLQLIFMPFVGGTTLGEVLVECRMRSRRPDRGTDLLTDLDLRSAPEYAAGTAGRPARELLSSLSYAQAIAWVVARLAEALDHAYRLGVTHGDLKPSNILIAADGQPILLDFNLSTDWQPDAPPASSSGDAGGTIAYMAPERLRAIAEPELASPPRPEARHRADLYALGLILREALTGRPPLVPSADDSPRSARDLAARLAADRSAGDPDFRPLLASVPPGLRVILRRCLSPAASERYPLASQLAEDLDRWRCGLPLAHAHPPRWLELARWARRRRRPLLAAVLCVTLGVVGTGAASVVQERLDTKDTEIQDGYFRQFKSVRDGFESVAEHRTMLVDLRADSADYAEKVLLAYDLFDDTGPSFWDRPDVAGLTEPDRSDLQCLVLEQALVFGLEATKPDYDAFPEYRRRALSALDRLRGLYSIEPIEVVAARLLDLLDQKPLGPSRATIPAPPWMEAYLSGFLAEYAFLAESANPDLVQGIGLDPQSIGFQRAMTQYQLALADRPELYYPRYRFAVVAIRVNNYAEADGALVDCLERRPHIALLWFGRGMLWSKLGSAELSLEYLSRAIELDPMWEIPYRNVAMLGAKHNRPELIGEAVHRFRLLTKSRDPFLWKHLFAELAMVSDAVLPSQSRSIQNIDSRPLAVPFDTARIQTDYAIAREAQLTERYEEAMDGYSRVIHQQPAHLRAWFNRGVLLQRVGRLAEAYAHYRYLAEHPDFELLVEEEPTVLVLLAVLSGVTARAGDVDASIRFADNAARHAGRVGHFVGEAHYALARAHASASLSDPSHLHHAVDALFAAGRSNPNFIRQRFPSDPMFDGRHAEFAELLGNVEY